MAVHKGLCVYVDSQFRQTKMLMLFCVVYTQSEWADNLMQHEVEAHTSVTQFELLGDMSGSLFLPLHTDVLFQELTARAQMWEGIPTNPALWVKGSAWGLENAPYF